MSGLDEKISEDSNDKKEGLFMDVFAFLTDFPLILTIWAHFLAARPECFMQYLRNCPTDFGFQWRIRTA